jgi:single-stranded-DNA-specific exonuclease
MNSVSVTGEKWILKRFDQEKIVYLKDNFFFFLFTAKLLVLRNIKKEDINSFLNPSIKNFLPNPNNLLDMEKSSLRTLEAIKNKEKIGVFGDYDVDGATSTALLGKYFNEIKLSYEIYIPDRKTEGYGPSIKGFEELIKKGVKVIFTVDCGTLSFEVIDYAKSKNIDVIVLDHHQSEINLPKAYSVVNPNRLDDKSDLQYLCAAGVTFMFLVSINRELRLIELFLNQSINLSSLFIETKNINETPAAHKY